MKYGRKDPIYPVPLDTFPHLFKNWWQTLQPTERGDTGDARPSASIPFESWSRLTCSGRNGLYLVLLGLFWWRHALDQIADGVEGSTHYEAWDSVAIDVLWALSAWTTCCPSPSSSRSSSPASSPEKAATAAPSRKRLNADEGEPVRQKKRRR